MEPQRKNLDDAEPVNVVTRVVNILETSLARGVGHVVSLRSALILRNVLVTLDVLGMARRSKEFSTLACRSFFSPVYCSEDSAVLCADEHKMAATSARYIRFIRREWLGLVPHMCYY